MARKVRRGAIASALFGVALVAALPGVVAATDPGADVRVHEGDSHERPDGAVCNFHLHFVNDEDEDGYWEIWTADGSERVADGQYSVTADLDDLVPDSGTMTLPDGDYELRWDIEPVDGSRDEQDFSVDCPDPTPTPTPTPTPSGSVAAETGTPAPTPTPPPGGGVAAETGTPAITLPPTDSLAGSGNAGSGYALAALLLAVSASLLVVARPVAERVRRRRR